LMLAVARSRGLAVLVMESAAERRHLRSPRR